MQNVRLATTSMAVEISRELRIALRFKLVLERRVIFLFFVFFLRMLREHSILFTFNLIRARYHFNSRVLTIWIEIEMFEINCRIYVMKIFIPVNMIFFLYLIRYIKVIFLFFLRMLREHLILFTFNFI